jgi:hypothetical protein
MPGARIVASEGLRLPCGNGSVAVEAWATVRGRLTETCDESPLGRRPDIRVADRARPCPRDAGRARGDAQLRRDVGRGHRKGTGQKTRDQEKKPKVDDKAYRSAIDRLPDQEFDPWANTR